MRLIEHVSIAGLLSFGWNPVELELLNLNVLIGPNGAGKSNLIAVLNLLHAINPALNCQAWYREDGQGAILGQTIYTQEDLEEAKTDDMREDIAATLVAERSLGMQVGERGYFYWKKKEYATRALTRAQAVIDEIRKNNTRADWAVVATALGWEPPGCSSNG